MKLPFLTGKDGSGERPVLLRPISESDGIENMFGYQRPNEVDNHQDNADQVHDKAVNGSLWGG